MKQNPLPYAFNKNSNIKGIFVVNMHNSSRTQKRKTKQKNKTEFFFRV